MNAELMRLKKEFTNEQVDKILDECNMDPDELLQGIPNNNDDLNSISKMSDKDLLNFLMISVDDKNAPNAKKENTEEVKSSLQEVVEKLKNEIDDKNANEKTGTSDKVIVSVEHNNMEANIMLVKGSSSDGKVKKSDIENELKRKGIKKGIKYKYIQRLSDNPIYDIQFKIAKGKEVIDGKNGKIDVLFNNIGNNVFFQDSNGNVNYKDKNNTCFVKKGDLLATIEPPKAGIDGYDIFGNVIKCKEVKSIENPLGDNVEFNNDKTKIYSKIDGLANFAINQVSVNKILTVDNVDYSTGDINFYGTLVVRGNVYSGFTVNCTEDIIVEGYVEETSIYAGNDIVIKGGMNGGKNKKGYIEAGGEIKSSFLENVRINAKGNVMADVILNCKIETYGDIILKGSKGCLIGGECSTCSNIIANTIGNITESSTNITINGLDYLRNYKVSLLEKLNRYQDTVKKFDSSLRAVKESKMQPLEKVRTTYRITITIKKFKTEIEKLKSEIEKVNFYIIYNKTAKTIRVNQQIYPNVKIQIDEAKLLIKNNHSHCEFYKDKDEIKISDMLR